MQTVTKDNGGKAGITVECDYHSSPPKQLNHGEDAAETYIENLWIKSQNHQDIF